MTRNPMIRTVVAIAIPALLLMQMPVKAECTHCATPSGTVTSPTIKNEGEPKTLVKLNSGTGYIVSNTLHEAPYITVSSQQFLEELGKAYLEKCREKKIGEWPFVITQVVKSADTKEAILGSTAVRISWIRFGKEELQSQSHLNTLIDALMELRDKETCLVKFEGKQACFKVLVNESKVEELQAVARQ